MFRDTHTWFKTRVKNPAGSLNDCLIIPLPPENDRPKVGLILPDDEGQPSHMVDNKEARLRVVIKEHDQPISPFHFKFGRC